jgi:uncharacterized protein (TIGR03086 family)
MSNLTFLHRQALESTRRIVANVRADQWASQTPCEGWDARALTNHIVSGNFWAAEIAAGKTIEEVGDRLDGDVLGNDPAGAYSKSAAAAAAAFEAPGALEAPCAVSYGPVPGSVYLGHRFVDVLVHGWDLAVATDQAANLDPALIEACIEVIGPQEEMLRASGMFGDEVDLPARADSQARLLATLGRRA